MNVVKFHKEELGDLTVLHNEKTGKTMFLLKEVAKQWGHTNATQAAERILSKDDKLLVEFKDHPSFKKLLNESGIVAKRAPSVMLINESGLYKLALASNLEKAKPFKDWVTGEVLPSIREHGYYSIVKSNHSLLSHTNTSVQKNNSKEVNSKNYRAGGVDKIIEYNRESCLLHTGKTPSEIKQAGKDLGLKSTQRTSAKEVLRNTNKPLACTMSFTDQLVAQGHNLKEVSELAMKAALPLFDGMVKLGVIPQELND